MIIDDEIPTRIYFLFSLKIRVDLAKRKDSFNQLEQISSKEEERKHN